ncbi:MAG: hypothetical protein LBM00_11165 [Deltaproteobacteria bacterium]|jgi:hypothetical protein|nr:hypothetical protein [Deltaproteobacteria bacterium]
MTITRLLDIEHFNIENVCKDFACKSLPRGELASAVAARQLTDEDSSDASPLSYNLKRKMP